MIFSYLNLLSNKNKNNGTFVKDNWVHFSLLDIDFYWTF